MSGNDPSIQMEIVTQLLSENNLEQKTELDKPIRWSVLSVIQEYLDEQKLPKSSSLLSRFVTIGMRYLISKNRQSRKEYIEALNALNDMDKSGEISDKSK